jgi:O-antigen ligase
MSVWAPQQARLHPSLRRLGTTASRDRLLTLLLGAALLTRVLTDSLALPTSRTSGSIDLSGSIALLLMLSALALLLRRRHSVLPVAGATLWICIWTAIAMGTHGASTETLREGVREGSVVALAAIVYNARSAIAVPTAARMVQLIGLVPALLAIHQLATHTGMNLAGNIRASGTFAHPDSAAMFFGIATAASVWLFLDERRRFDALLVALFVVATIATLSIDGLVALVAMLLALGVMRPGPVSTKLVPCAIAGAAVVAFLATPLGAQRIANESTTNLTTAARGEASTSLDWRLHKWETLVPQWESSPFFGEGLGTTTTTEPIPGNRFSGKPPHNEYVRYLVETGIVGLASMLAALALLLGSLARKWRADRARDTTAVGAPALAIVVLVGCLVNALADNTFLNSPTCYAAALIVIAALSAPDIEQAQANARRTRSPKEAWAR